MKNIAYFVTDSGFGHITRAEAIVNELVSFSDYNVIILSNEKQNEHARASLRKLGDRVSFINMDTDADVVLKAGSLEVDIKATEESVKDFHKNFDDNLESHYEKLKDMDIVAVITDISILGVIIAKRLGVKAIGVSNYNWYNRFKKFGIKDEILDFYLKWYNQIDLFIRFKYSDDMTGITCPMKDVGFVCRKVNGMNSGDFKSTYWPVVYLSVGQVEKKKEKFNIDFPSGTIVATGAIEVEGNAHLVKLPARVTSTQDYIAASAFALIKGGWSSVAECLILGVPMGILKQGDSEDDELVSKLVKENLAFEATEEEIRNFSMKEMNIRANSVSRPKVENEVEKVAKLMIDNIK